MGTETTSFSKPTVKEDVPVKLNNPLMGTETQFQIQEC